MKIAPPPANSFTCLKLFLNLVLNLVLNLILILFLNFLFNLPSHEIYFYQ